MSDDDKFLARWSRRKLRPASGQQEQPPREQDDGVVSSEVSANSASSEELKSPFASESLPPIESIGAGSDVRAFFAAGVPPELTRAALRRLWSSDPKIRDFVGLSENSWDFNAPGAMAGFGPMDDEQARRVLTQLLGDSDTEAVASRSMDIRREVETDPRESDPLELKAAEETGGSAAVERRMLDAAIAPDDATQPVNTPAGSQHASALPQHRPARRKGGALPE